MLLLLCRPDYFLPWQNHPKRESTGTGFVIRDKLILTNAHVVADQTYVTVKRHGSGTKYRAGAGAVICHSIRTCSCMHALCENKVLAVEVGQRWQRHKVQGRCRGSGLIWTDLQLYVCLPRQHGVGC
jgi:hypothetical protein